MSTLVYIKQSIKKKMLGTSDTWSTSHLSQETSKQVYYIVDCRILECAWLKRKAATLCLGQIAGELSSTKLSPFADGIWLPDLQRFSRGGKIQRERWEKQMLKLIHHVTFTSQRNNLFWILKAASVFHNITLKSIYVRTGFDQTFFF